MSPPASCFRGAHRLLPGCNQLHAVHPALMRHAGKLFYWSLLYSIRLYGYVIYIYILYYVYIYIMYIYIICTCSYLSLSLSCVTYPVNETTNTTNQPIWAIFKSETWCWKSIAMFYPARDSIDPQISFGVAEILRPCCWGLRRAARFSSHGFGNGWKCLFARTQNSSRPTFWKGWNWNTLSHFVASVKTFDQGVV